MLELLSLAAIIILLSYLAYMDFWYLKLPNKGVFLLTLLVIVHMWANPDMHWQTNLLSGLLLFMLGVVFWLLKLMAAGDAKLMLPLGLLIGLPGYLTFALGLLLFTIALYLSIQLAKRMDSPQHPLLKRLSEIAIQGQVPFGIPLIGASVIALL